MRGLLPEQEHSIAGETHSGQSNELLAAVAAALSDLLTVSEFPAAVLSALEVVGRAAQVHRVKVIVQEPAGGAFHHELQYEWCAPHLKPQASILGTHFSNADIEEDYLRPLKNGKSIWHLIDDVRPPLREAFELAGMKSMGVVPIFVGGNYGGCIAFDDCVVGRRFSSGEIYAMTIAANAIGSSIHRRRLEERAAEQARSLAHANLALQATIDTLGEERNLNRIVPRVLKIVAETFSATSCAVFENSPSGTIWLRYWNVDGRTLSPDEVMQLDPVKYGLVRRLAEGFTVSDVYLGMPSTATGTALIDHVKGTDVPEFDSFAVGAGWELELNIGVGTGGLRASTLCIYRLQDRPFSKAEIVLAESLATQLGLAVQFAKLAEEAKDAAVAREREAETERRAAEGAKANAALTNSLDAVGRARDLEALQGVLLESLTEYFGAIRGCLWKFNDDDGSVTLQLEYAGGRMLLPEQSGYQHDARHFFNPEHKPSWEKHQRLIAGEILVLDVATSEVLLDHEREHLVEQGAETLAVIPLSAANRHLGRVALGFPDQRTLTPGERSMAMTLSNQISLSLEMIRMARELEEVAVSRERGAANQRRITELASVNSVLTSSLARLSETSDMREFMAHVFAEILRVTGATNVLAMRYDRKAHQVQLELYQDSSGPRWGMSGNELAIWGAPFSPDITPAFRIALERRQIFAVSMADEQIDIPLTSFALPGGMEWLAAINASDAVFALLFAGDQPVGTLHLHFTGGRTLRKEDLPLLNALSQQAAIALRLVMLSDEAQEAALAQQRAAELAKANRALKSAVDSLAAARSGPLLLQGIVMVLRETLDAVSVLLSVRDEKLFQAIMNGNPALEAEVAEPGLAEYLQPGKPEFHPLTGCSSLSPEAAAHMAAQGIGGQLTVPLILGTGLIGAFKIRVRTAEVPPREQVELAQSLAHQATLAIRLAELAIEAQNEAAEKAKSEERAALARELHDTLLQSFTGITLQLRALGRRSVLDEASRVLLADIEQQATDSVQEARRAVGSMRNTEKIDLSSSLRRILEAGRAEAAARSRTVQFEFTETGSSRELPPAVAKDMVRIANEGLRNAVQHSGALHIGLALAFLPGKVSLLVEDDGNGFHLQEALSRPANFGLAGIQERARHIQADLRISTKPGSGTSILLEFPAGGEVTQEKQQ